ncbi:MAG: AMP-binding protein [Clostridiales Family XIII bacterium]|jgi:long-chain acyl-CoA synthetase|nr:AMP-binding protein [Clostridiales Family XIII bacterium]
MDLESCIYTGETYPARELTDLRDLILGSASLYAGRSAYLVKNRPGGKYEPVLYSRVKSDMNALGTAMLADGLGGARIAVIGENRYEWALTYFAVVCGVGVIVPIDKELKEEEISSLLTRSGVGAVVYSGKYEKTVKQALEHSGCSPLAISMDAPADDMSSGTRSLGQYIMRGIELLAGGDNSYTGAPIDPDRMAALLFTSGTTGRAKGVMLSHRNIASNVVNISSFIYLYDKTVLSVLPMHHTYEFTCLVFTAFYQGCTVAISEGLKYIVKNLEESKTQILLSVPLFFEKMYANILRAVDKQGKKKQLERALSMSRNIGMTKGLKKRLFKQIYKTLGGHIELLIAGGAAMDPEIIENFNAMGIQMIQGYGMTECSPLITLNRRDKNIAAAAGMPLPCTEIKIVDADESSGIGEVAVKSPSVMLGYFDDPEETAAAIRDGWLFTGDYGYISDDGFLYITGRKKNVIITKNGKNVYPEEIEYHLLHSPLIEEVVVRGEDRKGDGDTVIVAEVFPSSEYFRGNFESGGMPDEKRLLELITGEIEKTNLKMANYKRVRRVVIRKEEFEKTSTQKIKRGSKPM